MAALPLETKAKRVALCVSESVGAICLDVCLSHDWWTHQHANIIVFIPKPAARDGYARARAERAAEFFTVQGGLY